MISIVSISDLFVYPKFSSAVNLPTQVEEVLLDQQTQIWLKDVLVQYFNDELKIVLPYRIRPWSQVFKVETNRSGIYFLKIPAAEFCQEGQILQVIEAIDPDIKPKMLARNETNGAFLMAALEGETLRGKARKLFDQTIFEDCAARTGYFQKISQEHMLDFESLDIPKWTSETIIAGCESLIYNSRFLSNTELSSDGIFKFRSLFPLIRQKLNILTDFDKGLSIEHGDFQDNNIFIWEDRILFMDWADASISIPSFTIGTYCHSILLAHQNITNKAELIRNILKKYYFNLLGLEYTELHQCHASLVHFLYPVICILKVGRLLNLKEKKSDKYASTIIDYWIRLVISFTEAYRYQSLRNEII